MMDSDTKIVYNGWTITRDKCGGYKATIEWFDPFYIYHESLEALKRQLD